MYKQFKTTMKEGYGKFLNRRTVTRGKKYDSFFFYVPAEVARDGLNPFTPGEKVKIIIDAKNQRFIIEKIEAGS